MTHRFRGRFGGVATFLLTLSLLAALAVSGCAGGTEAWKEQTKEVAQTFWQAVMAEDIDTVARTMAQTADQTAEEIIAAYEGFEFSGSAHPVPADGYQSVQAFVLVGLLTPDGDTTLHLTAMSLSDGQWMVVHVGQGYTEQANGS